MLIAKAGKPHTTTEKLVLIATTVMVNAMVGQKAKRQQFGDID
jgi:N-methylhydantoinase A/oxoprolinase/acetone carboxylase beta subunit